MTYMFAYVIWRPSICSGGLLWHLQPYTRDTWPENMWFRCWVHFYSTAHFNSTMKFPHSSYIQSKSSQLNFNAVTLSCSPVRMYFPPSMPISTTPVSWWAPGIPGMENKTRLVGWQHLQYNVWSRANLQAVYIASAHTHVFKHVIKIFVTRDKLHVVSYVFTQSVPAVQW